MGIKKRLISDGVRVHVEGDLKTLASLGKLIIHTKV